MASHEDGQSSPKPKFSWGPPTPPATVTSFEDIMKEQQEVQQKSDVVEATGTAFIIQDKNIDTSSDELLAQLLQDEFDAEFVEVQNGSGKKEKFIVGFDPFSRPPVSASASDDEDDPNACWDTFDKKSPHTLGRQGFAKEKNGKVLSTKHDAATCARRNACRVMELKSDIETGDGGGFDMKINNNVFNVLKAHSIAESKRMARLHEKKEKSTAESVMDEKSRLLIFKLINQGLLDEVNGAINTGKEANVYHGIGGNSEKQVSVGEVAIKVYKTTLNEFKNREPYIKDDYRFKDKFSKANNRKIITLWAEKEMHNLNRLHRAGLPCPEVVCLKKHVLVMTFIGQDGRSAPTLKDAPLSQSQIQKAYSDTVDIMGNMYTKCDLVHADLSEFNLLWYDGKVWVIDVSQSVFHTHPHALGFLLRDCVNVTNFFNKRGASDVKSAADLFTDVCGKVLPEGDIGNFALLAKVEEYERDMAKFTHRVDNSSEFVELYLKNMTEPRAAEELHVAPGN